jgi:fucose permease
MKGQVDPGLRRKSITAFWVACSGLAIIGLPDGSLGVAWPSIRTGFGLSESAFGLILICKTTGGFCAGIMSGHLLELRGSRRVLSAAAVLAACALLVIAVSPAMLGLCVGALLLGLGLGTIDSGLNATAALSFDARAINWMHGCYGLGAMAGPVAMTAIIVWSGQSWRIGYICLATVLACASLLFARRATNSIPARTEERGRRGGWNAARHPLVQLQVVLFFVYTGIEIMLGQWSYSILISARGMPDGVAGLCTGAYWGGIAVGRFVLGAIIDRFGADRLLRCCTVSIVFGSLLFAFANGIWAAAGLIFTGLALSPVFPTLMARAPERLGPSVALHAIGFKVSAGTVGGTVFSAIGGLLADAVGLNVIGWCAVGASCVLLMLHEALLAAAPPGHAVRNS